MIKWISNRGKGGRKNCGRPWLKTEGVRFKNFLRFDHPGGLKPYIMKNTLKTLYVLAFYGFPNMTVKEPPVVSKRKLRPPTTPNMRTKKIESEKMEYILGTRGGGGKR